MLARRAAFFTPLFALTSVLSAGLASRAARAQSIDSTTLNPNRALFQNGQYVDVTSSPRPQDRNPTGVNFSDCEQDLKLTFPLILSGFGGDSGFEVWAGPGNCEADAARGIGGVPTCWRVSPPANALLYTAPTSIDVSVYARDVLRFEGTPPPGVAQYDPQFHSGSDGETACHVQMSDAPVALEIAFIPVVISSRAGTGTSFAFGSLVTDLVGPPPPKNVAVQPGGGALTLGWSAPGNDPDVAGFAAWGAPSGGGDAGACSGASFPVGTVLTDPGGSGISLIPTQYAAGEIDSATATELTPTGLTAGTDYTLAVTSVDRSGNFGPPSTPACGQATAEDTRVKAGCGCATAGASRQGALGPVLAAALVVLGLRRRAVSRAV